MFRKLLIFILIAGVCAITPDSAQDTIGIYADFGEGEGLARSIITKPGTPFDGYVSPPMRFPARPPHCPSHAATP